MESEKTEAKAEVSETKTSRKRVVAASSADTTPAADVVQASKEEE